MKRQKEENVTFDIFSSDYSTQQIKYKEPKVEKEVKEVFYEII